MLRYVVAGLLLAAPCARAQSQAEMAACIDGAAGVSSRMLDCGKVQIDKWDARLNAAYRTLLRQEKEDRRARLQAEQRAWLNHHLSETSRLAGDPNTGSGAFMLSQNFELDDLANRTLVLESRLRGKR